MNQEKISGGINGNEPEIKHLKVSLGEAIKVKNTGGAEKLEKFREDNEIAEKFVRLALGEDVFERDEKEGDGWRPGRKINDYEKETAARLKKIGQDLDEFYKEQILAVKGGGAVEKDLIKKINAVEAEIWDIFHKRYPLLKNDELNAKLKPIFINKKTKARAAAENNYV